MDDAGPRVRDAADVGGVEPDPVHDRGRLGEEPAPREVGDHALAIPRRALHRLEPRLLHVDQPREPPVGGEPVRGAQQRGAAALGRRRVGDEAGEPAQPLLRAHVAAHEGQEVARVRHRDAGEGAAERPRQPRIQAREHFPIFVAVGRIGIFQRLHVSHKRDSLIFPV